MGEVNRPKKFIRIVLIAAFLNTLLCFIIAFFFLKKAIKNDADMTLLVRGSWFTTFLLGQDKKPPKNKFLFIDVSKDIKPVDLLDQDGFPAGNIAITDRQKLSNLFNILATKPKNQPLILCDVLFDIKSPQDSALNAALNKLPNVVIPYTFGDDGKSLVKPVFTKVKKGMAIYETHNNTFMKFRLAYGDSILTIPLKMYEITHQKKFTKGTFFNYLGGKPILTNFVPKLPIRNYDLFDTRDTTKKYNWLRLGELLDFGEEAALEECKNRILVLGSFSGNNDKHESWLGDMYGPLILLNTYLALVNGDNVITWGWMIFLFLGFFLMSFFLFWQTDFKKMKFFMWLDFWLNRGLFKHIIRLMTYVFGLSTISVISFLFFGIHLNIMVMGGFFYLLDSLVKYFYRKKGWLPKPALADSPHE